MTAKRNKLLPDKGQPYWYLHQTCAFGRRCFDLKQTVWGDYWSDRFRYCTGNIYLTKEDADKAHGIYNEMLIKISK